MTDRLPHTVRSDARDNRARILDAARAVFGEEGLSAPLREVARHAGVGPRHAVPALPDQAGTTPSRTRTCGTDSGVWSSGSVNSTRTAGGSPTLL